VGFCDRQVPHRLDLKSFGPPLIVIYVMADIGSIGGGYLSCALITRGWSLNAGRKLTLLVCALLVVPIAFAPLVANVWAATLLIGLAAAAHQGWSANLFTLVSDSFPRPAIASVVGLGGMFGAVGGMVIAQVVSHVLQWTNNSYAIPFLIAACAYLMALAIIQLLVPRVGERGRAETTMPSPR
jgi:ACS family hexuronate transporter-like MFS transporter